MPLMLQSLPSSSQGSNQRTGDISIIHGSLLAHPGGCFHDGSWKSWSIRSRVHSDRMSRPAIDPGINDLLAEIIDGTPNHSLVDHGIQSEGWNCNPARLADDC